MDLDWKKRLKARFAANNNIIEDSSESYPDAKFLKAFKEDLSSSYNPGVAYFLVDRKQMESTVWSIGVTDVLGYEKVGSLGEFLSWVHPKYKNFFWMYTEKGRDILMDKKIVPVSHGLPLILRGTTECILPRCQGERVVKKSHVQNPCSCPFWGMLLCRRLMRQVPPECDINFATNGLFLVHNLHPPAYKVIVN